MAVGLPWGCPGLLQPGMDSPPPSSTLSPTAPYCCPHPITPQGTSTATQRALEHCKQRETR